ncbi:SPOR domain-containing protein [Rhodovulum sp. P5]|uniref:SPOR domain-containing protein n=1 Tax=Rhodovulum sp. P5 TaxID=1564506 RepID=UPI0009DB00FC|nr:SPOR domain-containing protein [Rhodovulum sp. P5]
MADMDFNSVGGFGGSASFPPIKTVLNWAGGVASLALVAGLVNWGIQIMVRDVSGVPVVVALEGPMRVAPDNPGGQLAQHQGLAVNRVAAEGEAAPPPDTLRLAPQPVSLADEDLPQAAFPRGRGTDLRAVTGAVPEPDAPLADIALIDISDELPLGADMEQAPLTGEEVLGEEVLDLPPGALRVSPRPQPRPDTDLAARAAIAAATAALAQPRVSGELPAAEVIAGTALVQLGAFNSTEDARAGWDRLAGRSRFAAFFETKSRVVQQAGSGDQVFYRLRAAGFENLDDARRFCAALTAEGADCIPVVAR